MPQPISDYKLFFANARQAVEELDGLIFEEKQLTEETKDIGADIEYEQKLCEDTIASDIEKNRNNICRQYDDIIKKQKADFKKVSAEREKAKNQGIKDRISEETADLRAENRNLQVMIREMFVNNKVPEFCNTDIYYSLYFPNKFTDFQDFGKISDIISSASFSKILKCLLCRNIHINQMIYIFKFRNYKSRLIV